MLDARGGEIGGVERLVDHAQSSGSRRTRIIAVLMLRGPDHMAMRRQSRRARA
jgi:hypothetical protein